MRVRDFLLVARLEGYISPPQIGRETKLRKAIFALLEARMLCACASFYSLEWEMVLKPILPLLSRREPPRSLDENPVAEALENNRFLHN